MRLSFGPMEGVTGRAFRLAHHRLFGGVEQYHAPFIAPDGLGNFKIKSFKDLLPQEDSDIQVVPQLLVNRPQAFLTAAEQLRDLGYRQVELNIGCPSATVVGKHKGSGMLQDLDSLRSTLDQIFASSPLPVWIKTRLGMERGEEFERIFELYCQYPIARLTIHARPRSAMYKAPAQPELLEGCVGRCPFPLWYNGDIFAPEDLERLGTMLDSFQGIMLARGAAADPALPRRIQGGEPLEIDELRTFHYRLLEDYLSQGSPQAAVARLKELWSYMLCKFPGCRRQAKALFKARTLGDFSASVEELLSSGAFQPLRPFQGHIEY